MRKVFRISLFCICLLFSFNGFAGPGSPFNHIVFFGDSLTDNGNLYHLLMKRMPKSPPYFNGRFTNGLVWADNVSNYFADKYAISAKNYSMAGETIILHDPRDGYLPYTFALSIQHYLMTSNKNRENTLFVIWLGSNDYLNGADDVAAMTDKVAVTFKKDIEKLITKGGRNFLILNLPDLSATPYSHAQHLDVLYQSITSSHNTKIEKAMQELQDKYSNINMHIFSMNLFVTGFPEVVSRECKKKLVLNTTEPCWTGKYTLRANKENDLPSHLTLIQGDKNVEVNAQQVLNSPALREAYHVMKLAEAGQKPCAFPDDYFFWDQVHPSRIVHKMMAIMIDTYIEQHYQRA